VEGRKAERSERAIALECRQQREDATFKSIVIADIEEGECSVTIEYTSKHNNAKHTHLVVADIESSDGTILPECPA
jgi:hypothetical protein